jgi:hypothetical protein
LRESGNRGIPDSRRQLRNRDALPVPAAIAHIAPIRIDLANSRSCAVTLASVDTIRVDISYRPLRVGWAIKAGDIAAFRHAVRLSYALWGGRYNPILIVDNDEEETKYLVDLFRVDLIVPLGTDDAVLALPKRFPYLINPNHHDSLFVGSPGKRKYPQILDIENAIAYLFDRADWQRIKQRGLRLYTWQSDDPLTDVFLIHCGDYPSAEETSIDYRMILKHAADATEHALPANAPIPADLQQHPSIPFIGRVGMERHYSIHAQRDMPGFFIGDARDVADLVACWNLRATDTPVWFVDPQHIDRYAQIIPVLEKWMRQSVAHRHEWDRAVGLWSRRDDTEEVRKPFESMNLIFSHVTKHLWNGLNLHAPMMHLGSASVLGVVSHEQEKVKVAFALSEKPFSGGIWFHSQHLVASISFGSGLFDAHHTLQPPHVPELNEFYARTMHFMYDRLRIEPERVGLVIDANDNDAFLYALPVSELMERIFDMASLDARLSSSGLIVRQLIARLDDLQGARAFKIPGVRRLFRTYGPTDTFTKKSALQLIGSTDPETPLAKFSDHEHLYIEPRPREVTKLTPGAVFSYLVAKGLFRIGVDLTCPHCRLRSWTALDSLKHRVICELCGDEHDATRQLVHTQWHYRRSGVLGTERNAQGAVPVALTLQQLQTTLHDARSGMYSPSLNLKPKSGANLPECEVDFVWLLPHMSRMSERKTAIILGECKDQGPIGLDEFEKDVANLRRIADALPEHRFSTFVLLSKLAPFTAEEIQRARTLNTRYRQRAILLTARELEPYFIYERTKLEFENIRDYGGSPEDLAATTAEIYFPEARR